MIEENKVTIIGMGYVGFPLACAIAREKKYKVFGLDIDKKKIDKINQRICPIEDKQAEEDMKQVNIHASMNFENMRGSKFIIICVPTPVSEEYEPDFGPIQAATREICKQLEREQIIILESTINPGASEDEVIPILEESGLKSGVDFDFAHCPERIDPGNEEWNVYNIPRNIGSSSPEATKRVAEFYRSFLEGEIHEMSCLRAVEATKIIENTFRDINIAFVNELAKSFDQMDIDLDEVIKAAANKPFAFMPHFPGSGVGGHCIPVDPYYLIRKASKEGFEHDFLKLARRINNSMPKYTVELLRKAFNEAELPLKNRKVAILGLSYKANIGDLRESPALKIIKHLREEKPEILVHDPFVSYEGEERQVSLEEVFNEADALILVTNHKEYLHIKDWGNIKIIIDGRNCLNHEEIREQGILYLGIGRGRGENLRVKKVKNTVMSFS